ncbi:aspartate carbamoyltransferase catalytic subunit [Anaeromyxobacter oryzisoli]|uniref:aspartate carbamoyltransferase catalytic subunit n=1 Tax=Anaeromyxobacter oryzisoli TaxID=2925408 RepID=UPI001F5764EF|nr:aspartate carbamoyltransferase catalytic subunit [Anaeromyxobacter sp. SG63]
MIGRHKHCIALADYSREEILEVLDLAVSMKEVLRRPIKKVPSLRGRSIVNLFFEASTRTRSSFEIAAKTLSADLLNWTASASSVTKGETLIDTARNLEAMRPDVLVIRHAAGGAPRLVAEHVGCAVVSAGDGAHEHPSQGLLDCFTLREKLGTLEGKTVAIVGDISHSRVARSDLHSMPKLGAKMRLCGPPTMIPAGVEALGATVHYDLREAVEGADAIVMLRIQHERIGDPLIPGTREYSKFWGLNAKKAAEWLKPSCVILHPGPVNRGVELSPEVADGPHSVILDQVQNGVAVRMAILYLLAGGTESEAKA